MPGRRHAPPLPAGPHGKARMFTCAGGCGARVAGYEGVPPGKTSAPWTVEGELAWCPHCATTRRPTPRCADCGIRAATDPPDADWVLHRGVWFCGFCADRPRRRR